MITTPERLLDDILEGRVIAIDQDLSPLIETATLLEDALRPAAPPMGHARALFAGGVAARKSGLTWRQIAVPAMAMLALVIAAGSIASRALPGDALYPVRKVLGAVGLVAPSTTAIDQHIVAAADLVETAEEALVTDDIRGAATNARGALLELDSAAALLPDLDQGQRSVREIAISGLEQRALAVISAPTGNQPGPTREETVDDSNPNGKGHEGLSDDEGGGDGTSPSEDEGSESEGSDLEGDDRSGSDGDEDSSGSGSDSRNDQEESADFDEDEVDSDKGEVDSDDDQVDEIDVVEEENG